MEFLWHDYETFGIDPRRDRPSQFAGVRTDEDFNPIDDPLVAYCKPPADYLPHPEACLLTGITPQLAEQKGLVEVEFIRQIHSQMARANTCVVGYNSIRFDDEFTRNCLYRNFYDPYSREWQNGCSRWDIIDLVRAAKALRPEGIHWPVDAEGRPSFRLEELTQANGIAHETAHDALSDVHATIALAKLIKRVQPKLYQFVWLNKTKTAVNSLLRLGSFIPLVHVSGRFPAAKGCLAVVLPLCQHPTNTNAVLVYDLGVDPAPLLSLSAEEIRQRVFTAAADLPEGRERIPLKAVHANKCPVLAPLAVLRPEDQQRLQIDLAQCRTNLDQIKAHFKGLPEKLAEVFAAPAECAYSEDDPDLMLYSGGFFPDRDKHKIQAIPRMTAGQLSDFNPGFIDARLPEMLFRYRARNFPESLRSEEGQRWRAYCLDKLTADNNDVGMTMARYQKELNRLRQDGKVDEAMLTKLANFAETKMAMLAIS